MFGAVRGMGLLRGFRIVVCLLFCLRLFLGGRIGYFGNFADLKMIGSDGRTVGIRAR